MENIQDLAPAQEISLQDVVRKRVAKAICEAAAIPEYGWEAYTEEADAAIRAHYQALIEMELPEEAKNVYLGNVCRAEDIFRAIIGSLSQAKGESHD